MRHSAGAGRARPRVGGWPADSPQTPGLPAAVLHGAGGRQPFRVHRQDPSPAAADVVHHLWAVDWQLPAGAEHTQEVLTFPCQHLTVEPDGCWVHGVVTRRFARTLTGVRPGGRRTPAGAGAGRPDRRGGPVRHHRPTAADRATCCPALRSRRRSRRPRRHAQGCTALDDWLASLPRHEVALGDLVEQAVALAQSEHGLTRVEDLARSLAVSPRTLQRHLGRMLGVSPKWVVRRAGIHDALESAAADQVPPDWADLAHRLGFADQAHFTNTFTAMVGVPPARYASLAAPTATD